MSIYLLKMVNKTAQIVDMKNSRIYLFVFAFITAGNLFAQSLPEELQTPEIVSVNRMPMRAEAFAFETKELAEKRTKENSAFFYITQWCMEV